MAPTQQALFIDKFVFTEPKGNKWVLKADHPIPKPGPGQVLVKSEAAALNPVDWKIRELGLLLNTDEQYPAVIGSDVAGVVQEVGEGVKTFAKGDRVVFQGSWAHDLGGYQQYVLSNVNTTAKVPASVSLDQAATLPVALAAAVVGFYGEKPQGGALKEPFANFGEKAYAGKPVVVIGGASSVGQSAIQLGKLSGFSQVITTASSKHEAFLKGLGATHVIDRSLSSAAVIEEVKKITGGKLPDFVFDAISEGTQQLALDLTASGGTTIFVLPSELPEESYKGRDFFHVLGIFSLPGYQGLGNRFYAALSALLEGGHIKPNPVEVLPNGLAGVEEGLKKLKTISGTKLVVHPQETPA